MKSLAASSIKLLTSSTQKSTKFCVVLRPKVWVLYWLLESNRVEADAKCRKEFNLWASVRLRAMPSTFVEVLLSDITYNPTNNFILSISYDFQVDFAVQYYNNSIPFLSISGSVVFGPHRWVNCHFYIVRLQILIKRHARQHAAHKRFTRFKLLSHVLLWKSRLLTEFQLILKTETFMKTFLANTKNRHC